MHSTTVGPQFWITYVLRILSLLLSFSACVTDKSQNVEPDWNLFTWKPPYTWPPSPCKKTRDPFPWEKTREPFPWEKTRPSFPWDEKNRFTIPPINFKNNYDSYKYSESATKLIIFIPPFGILGLYLVCKYCVFNHLSSTTSNTPTTLHVPPTHHSTTPENSRVRTGNHTISNENSIGPTGVHVLRSATDQAESFSSGDSRRNDHTSSTSEKPPDYASVVLSDLSEPTPKFPTVIPENKAESPPPYYVYENSAKY